MDLYLHIGYPKVGSTSIQNFLSSNYNELIKKGVLYPKSGRINNKFNNKTLGNSHNSLFTLFNQDQAQFEKINAGKFKANLSNEITTFNPQKVVISAEFFNRLKTVKRVIRFFQFFEFRKIYVIIYLRRPDMWLESLFLQLAKTRKDFATFTFEQFLRRNLTRVNYKLTIDKWKANCGKDGIKIHLLNHLIEKQISLEKSFLNSIQCDLEYQENRIIKKSNTRLNLDSLIYLQKKFPNQLRIGPKYNELIRKLQKFSSESGREEHIKYIINKENYQLIKHYSNLYNGPVAKEYFNSDKLFDFELYDYEFIDLETKIQNFKFSDVKLT